jgi:transmembrane sensor
MTQVSEQMNSAKAVEAQAVEWLIAREERQTWTDEDQKRLDSWLAQSPAHMTAFWRVEASWNRTELIADIRPFGFGENPLQSRGMPWLVFFRVAASLVFFAVLGAGGYLYFARPAIETFATPIGGRKIVTLFDGSQIELNTNTVLQIGANQRDVALVKGEAFFQIHHDAAHPFTVSVAGHRVTDLGTKFLIRTNDEKIEIALVEGRARVESEAGGQNQSATLFPGDVALATDSSLAVAKKTVQDLRDELAWRKGILVFDNTPLTDAAAEFNRYNTAKVVIVDPNAGHLKINGAIHANDGEEFARLAKNLFGLRAEQRGNEIVIGSLDAQ